MKGRKHAAPIYHSAPLWWPALAFLTGIFIIPILSSLLLIRNPSWQILWIAGLILLIYLTICRIPAYSDLRHTVLQYLLALGLCFVAGAFSCGLLQSNAPLQENSEAWLCARVQSVKPSKSGKQMRLYCKLIAYRQQAGIQRAHQNIFVYLPIQRYDSCISTGTRIYCHARIAPPLTAPATAFVSSNNDFTFTRAQASLPQRLRTKIMMHLQSHIKDPRAYALLAGLSLGSKEALDPELKSAYSSAGAMHVLAVSGLHVGIIYAILLFSFQFLGMGVWQNRIKQFLILSILIFYAALTGFSPSVNRAVLMTGLYSFSRLIRRPISSLQALSAAALILCLIHPLDLFEVGFQLSFCAVLAILSLQAPLQNLYKPKNKIVKYIWSLLVTSTAAQIGTAPLTIYYFHSFPYLFLITNLWVIPLTGLLLYLCCAWMLLGWIPFIGNTLLWLLEHTAIIMNYGVMELGN